MQEALEKLISINTTEQSIVVKLFLSALIIFTFWMTHYIVHKILWRKTDNIQTRYLWIKITNYIVFILAILIIGAIWIESFKQIGTFLGLLSAGIAISMKDLIVNFVGWIFILTRRPFTNGDRIQIGENAKAILDKIVNSSKEELDIEVEERIKDASKRFMIKYSNLTPFVYTSIKESGILLSIRYLCKPRKRRNSEHTIWESILKEFAKYDDIDFAYPTQRFYNSAVESKVNIKK